MRWQPEYFRRRRPRRIVAIGWWLLLGPQLVAAIIIVWLLILKTIHSIFGTWIPQRQPGDAFTNTLAVILMAGVALLIFLRLKKIAFNPWFRTRAERRAVLGLCPVCGYDLRASHDRCPECGTPIPPRAGIPLTEEEEDLAQDTLRLTQTVEKTHPHKIASHETSVDSDQPTD